FLWPKAMRNGLALLFVGIVLYFAVDRAGGSEGAVFMLIPAVLGLANLIYAVVIWKQEKDEPTKFS
ncbi:MAG TPA: cysteine-rich outer membrane protein, partial [Steroidobacteraceae bacterium]|nr:cysteine-rich outer membrane protein [Steroidobacteraceae bacterium]